MQFHFFNHVFRSSLRTMALKSACIKHFLPKSNFNFLMNMTRIILILCICLCTLYAEAQDGVKKYSNEFLSIGVNARAIGMGNSQVASANGAFAGYWNPAGLKSLGSSSQLAGGYTSIFSGAGNYGYLSYALPVGDKSRAVGFTFIRLSIDDIPNTLQLIGADGSINLDNITTFSASDNALLLSYAQPLGSSNRLSAGANAKIVYRTATGFSRAIGFGLDLGIKYALDDFTLGVMLQDVTTTFNAWTHTLTQEQKDVLLQTDNIIPTNTVESTLPTIRIGAAYNAYFGGNFRLSPELQADISTDGKSSSVLRFADLSVGAELAYSEFAFLRIGLKDIQSATSDSDGSDTVILRPTAGVGVRLSEMVSLDYALAGLTDFNTGLNSHVLSLVVDFAKRESIVD